MFSKMESSKSQFASPPCAGTCNACGCRVYESLALLDDAFAVWVGICPYCGAGNLLDTSRGGRGYSQGFMSLTLPYAEEVRVNRWPADWPTKEDLAAIEPGQYFLRFGWPEVTA